MYSLLAASGAEKWNRSWISLLWREACQLYSISMWTQSPCNWVTFDLSYKFSICIHLRPVYLLVADGPPLLPLMGSFDKDRLSHLLYYWSSIHLEAFITLRNFNCCKINRGCCLILDLRLVYGRLACRLFVQVHMHQRIHGISAASMTAKFCWAVVLTTRYGTLLLQRVAGVQTQSAH